MIVAADLARAVPTNRLGEKVASLVEPDLTIDAAFGMLISGY